MPLHVEYSHPVNRSVEKVFHFMVVEHEKNHPRWDSDIELWRDTEGSVKPGTIFKRRNTRSGTPVEGTMEVIEYEENRKFTTRIRDGDTEMIGGIEFESAGLNQTVVKTTIDFPDMDESADTSFLMKRLEEVAKIRQKLIESEV
jgi:hypothetical protein